MGVVGRGKSAVDWATALLEANPASARPSPRRVLAATIIPLLAVFTIEAFFWGATGRWTLFYPAVLVCALVGGFEAGVAATLLSTALIWWYFVPPEHVLLKPGAPKYLMAATFLFMGTVVSAVIRRMQRNAAELARHQRLLQGILEFSPDTIVIKDLDSRYILVSRSFEALTGIRVERALHHTVAELFPRLLAEDFRVKDKIVLETRAPVHFEERLEASGERVFLVSEFPLLDGANHVFAIGAIATDISQRKHDEEAVRESLEDLRAAEHVAHVGSWRWDFRTNRSKWSEELYQIFGIDRGRLPEPIVNPGLQLLAADSLDRLRKAMEKLRADGEPYELDLEFTRPDGVRRWCAARGEPLRDAGGQIIGINGTVGDITHIKELERLRDEWTSIIAHDLRQPIGVITMASEFLPELHQEPSQQERAMVQHIHSAAQALKRMVDDLLDMSLLEAHRLKLERKWIDALRLLREVLERNTRLTGAQVQLHANEHTATVFADPVRVEQVLGNLLSNAVKYGDPKSPIDVRLDLADREVTISVTNRGHGLAPEDMPRLFDRFMRSKAEARSPSAKGLGLGLYISKGIVEAHGGRIWADSKPGHSTTFYVSLPTAGPRLHAA